MTAQPKWRATALALALSAGALALGPASSPAQRTSAANLAKVYPGDPCCAITAINPRSGVTTVRHTASGVTFQVRLQDPSQLRNLRVGQAVSISQQTQSVVAQGASSASYRYASLTGFRGTVAQADRTKRVPNDGNCKWLTESSTEQCVLTHVTEDYCDYYCTPIPPKTTDTKPTTQPSSGGTPPPGC